MVDQNRERATGALHLYDVCTTFFQELRMYKNEGSQSTVVNTCTICNIRSTKH